MKKFITLLLLASMFSCNQQKESEATKGGMEITNDTIPETRNNVKASPVASYSEPVEDKDKLNDWKFSVDAFETPMTFKYLLKIRYKELRVEDTLTIPNFGIYPTIVLNKGPEDLSCIVGFKDKEDAFKDFKKVYIEKGELKITTLKTYRRTLNKKK
jgi:hypothetical protein